MKALIIIGMALLGLMGSLARAEEKNGLRVTAQKTVLDREKEPNAFSDYASVEKLLGLKVAAKNISFKEIAEGTLAYIIIVKRWGHSPMLLHRYAGSEKFPTLKPGEEVNLTVGKAKMSGYESVSNRRGYQDSVEGWQIVVSHGGAETIKVSSTSSFESLDKKAKNGPN